MGKYWKAARQAWKSRTVRLQIVAAICLIVYNLIPGFDLPLIIEVALLLLFITANIVLRFMTTLPIMEKK